MKILRELWTKEFEDPEVRTTYQYVVDLKERLEATCKMARENLERSSGRYRNYYNKGARERQISVGEKVLVLLPTASNNLLMQWKRPFTIVEKEGKVDYKIDMCGKLKTFHANMLKLYVERESDIDILGIAGVAVVDIEDDDDGNETLVDSPREARKEGPIDVTVSAELTDDQCNDVHVLLDGFSDVLSDLPGLTILGVHQIKLTSDKPIRSKPYPLPFTLRELFVRKSVKCWKLVLSSHPIAHILLRSSS